MREPTAVSRAGVKLIVDLLQPRMLDVSIDLRGLNVGVSKHLLDLPQVRSTGQQVRRETMTQRVRTDVAGDPNSFRVAFDESPQLDPIKWLPGAREKHVIGTRRRSPG